MKKSLCAFLMLCVAACNSPSTAQRGDPAPPSATSSHASTAQPTPPVLTVERLGKASSGVKAGDDWNKTRTALISELGPPTHEGYDRLVWGIPTAGDCTYWMIKESSGTVSEVTAAATYPRAKTAGFEDCYLYLDRTPPDKDPTLPGPIAGNVYSVRQILDGIDGTRSKWVGKKVRVRGRVLGVVRSGPSKEWTLASMTVADEKDASVTIGVQVTSEVRSAPRDGQKVVVTCEGTVASMGRSLDDARILK